jgi:SAM-dependent methyltransferase
VARVDYTGRAEAYRTARTLPTDVLASWRTALEPLDLPRPRDVLDLGAGPGGFLRPLTEWFDAPVVAVEPSAAMRDAARVAGLTERFPYLAAWAEALPLQDASIDLAWLSTVVHQFDDPAVAARELHRVVRPGGHVLVRGFFADVAITGLFAAFPGIERSAQSFPSTDAIVSCFENAGLRVARVDDVVEPWRFDLAAWTDRVRSLRSTDSALRPLTDTEFAEGLRVVTDTYRAADGPIGSDGTLRLIVFAA